MSKPQSGEIKLDSILFISQFQGGVEEEEDGGVEYPRDGSVPQASGMMYDDEEEDEESNEEEESEEEQDNGGIQQTLTGYANLCYMYISIMLSFSSPLPLPSFIVAMIPMNMNIYKCLQRSESSLNTYPDTHLKILTLTVV